MQRTVHPGFEGRDRPVSDTQRTYTLYGYYPETGQFDKLGTFVTFKAAEEVADQREKGKYGHMKIVETVTHTVIEWAPR